jgi:hypothetical protein
MKQVHATATQTQPIPGRAPTKASPTLARRVVGVFERNAFVISALAVCAAFQVAIMRSALQSDGWYSLVSGRLVARHGIPHHDTLTWLSLGRTWIDQQWLAHLALYAVWTAGGAAPLLLTTVLFYAGAFAVLAVEARRREASDRSVALVTTLAFFVGITNTVVRAQVPAYLLFALVLALLMSDSARPSRRIYLTLPLIAVWANVHGSVLLGAALVALYGLVFAAGRLKRRAAARDWVVRAAVLVGAPWLCVLVSPYGLQLPGYYRRVLDNPTLSNAVSEWGQSTLRGQPLFYALFLGGLVLAVLARRRLTPFALLALAGSGLFGLMAIRNIVWFALVAATVLPAALDVVWRPGEARRKTSLNVVLGVSAVGFAVVITAVMLGHGNRWYETSYPGAAVKAVGRAAAADPGARVFANERYADWLLYEDPALAGRVAYDVRFELFTQRQLKEIVAFRSVSGIDWQRAVDGYRLLVLDPKGDREAVRWLERNRGTTVLYRNGDVVVLRMPTG